MHITRISSLSKRLQIMEHNVDVQSFHCFILGFRAVSAHFQIAPATHQSVQTGAILLKCRSNTRRIYYVRYNKTVSVVMPAEVRKAGGLY